MKIFYYIICWFLLLTASSVQAQSFGDNRVSSSNEGLEAFRAMLADKKAAAKATVARPQSPAKGTSQDKVERLLKQEKDLMKKERQDFFMPQGGFDKLIRPTMDNSKRGNATFVESDDKGNSRGNSNIFMYMDNFSISHILGDVVTCDVRFVLLSNLDRRLVSFDAKLVWPNMTTAVSFQNISPNTPTGYTYTLIGEGCYSMDKTPNIVVNRCRIKGLSAAECAEKIIWLTKSK